MHAGVLTTLAQLREKFWIPKGRRVVKAILRQCIKCKRLTAGKVNPDPAPLPSDRIHRVAAFQITGADLVGPLSLRGESKAWIVLFTCAVYRAVHLELVSSLSTESFMQALRRFWARRGRGSTLIMHILKRVRYLHTLRSNLRKRFYKEYLGELVRSPKVASKRKMISPGEIVIVESKNPNRMNWPLAQVIELFPGKDGVERVAKLRLASGEIIRPLQRIYPLELSASDHLIEDHQGTDIAAQNPGPTAADVLEEVKKSRCGRPLIPVKRLL
ncbi:hypothetical protein AVEN_53817-1 [Araneus ventricosus]|uniref:DUF5641 domain-containing protein n=1 Tax=Araneus ventricosus TaxID=182803 RepID=A0A4Y2K9Z7_ARAVE|nr:hypothetical protein AVEN_53817-1 [Araneus ventricosus]